MTPETAELLKGVLQAMGKDGKPMSFGDWVENHVRLDAGRAQSNQALTSIVRRKMRGE
jgi:hypothetical protein